VVPTLIRDSSIGSGGNHCQKDTDCQLIVNGGKDGTTWQSIQEMHH
jgi:hypothetical protein